MTFGERGSALFEALNSRFSDDQAGLELLREACRLADRLDALDEAIAGKGVINLMRFRRMLGSGDGDDEPIQVEIHFDSVLAEARQQANTLRLLLGQIAPAAAEVKPVEKAQEGPSVDDLAARRRSRTSGSAPTA